MLSQQALKDLLQQKLGATDKLILCLAFSGRPIGVSEVAGIARAAGLQEVRKWNISSYLSRSRGWAIRVSEGWELTSEGKKRVAALTGSSVAVQTVAATLRTHLSKITNPDTAGFLDEAIKCYEAKMYRAAVVLSWVGALSLLYDHVIKHKLQEFNTEATRRDSKWQNAKRVDDLARIKEYDFLQILVAISVVGKNVKEELEACLKLRNGCGHPNSLQIGEARVSAHIETLVLNVFSVF